MARLFAVAMLLMSSSALAQVTPHPSVGEATSSPSGSPRGEGGDRSTITQQEVAGSAACLPIGQTAKRELVYSMECKELPSAVVQPRGTHDLGKPD
jgi:hypothetical protein